MTVNKTPWSALDGVQPFETNKPVILGIDQSKTGYAITTGDEYGNDLDYVELSGKGMKTDDFILEIKAFIPTYFSRVKILEVGYEKMILKKGLSYYHSSEVLHDVRVATKEIFIGMGHMPEEVNNMSWKGAILPDGYRGRDEKGSLRWCREIDPKKFRDATDNRTDSYCIYKYLVKKRGVTKILCDAKEINTEKRIVAIVPDYTPELKSIKTEFMYNYNYTLEENVTYFMNRSNESGKCYINLDIIPTDIIYNYARFFKNIDDDSMLIVIPTKNL